jgi:hypothetical protein
MHIVIGVISALAGLCWALIALQRSGLDLNELNPFLWARRRKWRKLYGTKPIFNLTKPLEVAAVLIVGILREEGEISREQKSEVLRIFEQEFHLDAGKAIEMYKSCLFLLKDEMNIDQSVQGIITPARSNFTPEQAESLINLLRRVAAMEGSPGPIQARIIEKVENEFGRESAPAGVWS